jgi:hypothetical protein
MPLVIPFCLFFNRKSPTTGLIPVEKGLIPFFVVGIFVGDVFTLVDKVIIKLTRDSDFVGIDR